MSLIEVVVALALAALMLPLMLDLLPTSALALQKAEDLQTATGVALQAIDTMRLEPKDSDRDVVLNGTSFHVKERAYEISEGVYDLVVEVEFPRSEPVRLATRFRKVEKEE